VKPLSALGLSPALPAGNSDANLKAHWRAQGSHLFSETLEDGNGFSFVYGEEKPVSTASPSWQVSSQGSGDSVETVFRHSSGLTARRQMQAYPEFDALEYTVTFK